MTLMAVIGLSQLDFDSGIELMLPDKDNIHKIISFLRNSNLTNKVVISLSLISEDKDKKDLIDAVEQLEGSLKPPLFTKTISGVSRTGIMDDILFSDYFAEIATEKDLLDIDGKINPVYVSERMEEIYRHLLRPQSLFTASILYSDPLGTKLLLLDKLKKQTAFTDYNVSIEEDHFISSDGRHAMIIATTPVAFMDSFGSKKLIQTLEAKIGRLPAYISADIVSGHLRSLSNEKVIKRDIGLTIAVASAAFLILFFVVFRDMRTIFVFLIPVFSAILSVNLSNLIMRDLAYWIVGLGTAIAGIAMDYGIHIFTAVRNRGNASGVIRHVARPISIGAITTIGIFAAFFFSDIRGYHQLALFSILSILFSLLLALFILPHFLSKGEWIFNREWNAHKQNRKSNLFAGSVVVLWIVLIVSALIFSFNVTFDSDIIKLDGSEPEILLAEEKFHEIWGGQESHAIFVVSDSEYEKALEINDIIYKEAVQTLGLRDFTSLSLLWPSIKTREANVARWNEFWRDGRGSELKKLIKNEGVKYQFSDSAFSPFFDSLYADVPAGKGYDNKFISILKERFVQKGHDGYKVLSYFPDRKEYVSKLEDLSRDYPGTFVVSRKALSRSISDSLSSDVKIFAMIATMFIVLLTFLFLKEVKKSLLALIPVVTSVLLILAFMSLYGLRLNIANLIAGIVSMGLCIDYGIFMTYRYENELKRSTVLALSISALTTLIGAGALLFAKHPALFSIGTTLVVGVTAGYISSVVVIPSIEKIFYNNSACKTRSRQNKIK